MDKFPDIFKFINSVKSTYKEFLFPKNTAIKAIYLFGSYPRNDFVIGHSDLDFAVILDVPQTVHHWIHPDFLQIVDLTKKSSKLPLTYLRSPGLDFITFSYMDIEQAKRNELNATPGPRKLLTFFAFDFLTHNELLWGEDLLQGFSTVPEPNQFASTRLRWIRSYYLRERNWVGSGSDRLLMTLGSIIRHFAVVKGGLRTLKRTSLRQWAFTYTQWGVYVQDILIPYFEFIEGHSQLNPAVSSHWCSMTDQFIRHNLNNHY